MGSAAKTESGGVYGNAQEAIACRISLRALGHPQPPTPIKTDNSTANSFVHANIKQRHSKTWDMQWNWLRDKATQTATNLLGQGRDSKASSFYVPTIGFECTQDFKYNGPSNGPPFPPSRCKGVFFTQLLGTVKNRYEPFRTPE
jgi:hypothetical protein